MHCSDEVDSWGEEHSRGSLVVVERVQLVVHYAGSTLLIHHSALVVCIGILLLTLDHNSGVHHCIKIRK